MPAIGDSYDASAFDLTQLHYVRAIAACGSMTSAAKHLRVSQPTLSVAVRDLEARLGASLFLRGVKGVKPTASGEILLGAIADVFALLRRTDERIRGLESTDVGRFVVGCYHSFGAYFMPKVMKTMAMRFPRIELALWEGTADAVRDAAVDHALHFGVAVAPRSHPDLVIVPMFRDVMCVVAARAIKAPTTLFHVPRIPSSEQVVAALRTRDRLPARVVGCGDLELVKSLVLDGAGAGVLPWRVATYNTPRGAVRLLDRKLPFAVDTAHLYYRADLHRTQAALRVRDALAARGRELDRLKLPCGVTSSRGGSA
ncbi:MAG: LysR family transcriptional regulator [Kofleriaceae bacterium]